MHNDVNKPVFVVGSPRSGTSILTWCLGQHPNMFPVPESNWMGDFAVNLAISYQVGTARGERAVLSAMDIGRDEFFAQFGRSINQLILSHRDDLNRKRKMPPSSEPKARWVDGTPEYSTHIFALRKLFPEAVFVKLCVPCLTSTASRARNWWQTKRKLTNTGFARSRHACRRSRLTDQRLSAVFDTQI